MASSRSVKKILIVEDEPAVRGLLLRLLERQGYQVVSAEDGRQGLALIDSDEFDLVISDIVMPGLKGIEMVRQLRNDHPDLPVLFVTGYPQEDNFRLSAHEQLLLKPFTRDQLYEKVQEVLPT